MTSRYYFSTTVYSNVLISIISTFRTVQRIKNSKNWSIGILLLLDIWDVEKFKAFILCHFS